MTDRLSDHMRPFAAGVFLGGSLVAAAVGEYFLMAVLYVPGLVLFARMLLAVARMQQGKGE